MIGLLGPNGAGKSTLLQADRGRDPALARRARASSGAIPSPTASYYRRIGFCPQQDALYDDMSGLEFVHLPAAPRAASRAAKRDDARRARARARRPDRAHAPRDARLLEGHAPARASIAQAIAHEPEFLVARRAADRPRSDRAARDARAPARARRGAACTCCSRATCCTRSRA